MSVSENTDIHAANILANVVSIFQNELNHFAAGGSGWSKLNCLQVHAGVEHTHRERGRYWSEIRREQDKENSPMQSCSRQLQGW